MITKEFVSLVRERIAANPEISTQRIAEELQSPEADIVMVLPKAMRIRADNTHFDEIWRKLSLWNNAILTLPGGHEGPFSSLCIATEQCTTQLDCSPEKLKSSSITCLQPRRTQAEWKESLGAIWFVYQRHNGRDSRSVRFYDKKGARLFLVSLESGSCSLQEALDYDELRARLGIITRPPKLGCGGGCRGCGKKGGTCVPNELAAM